MDASATLPERPKPKGEVKQISKRKARQSTSIASERPQSKRPKASSSRSRSRRRPINQESDTALQHSSSEDESTRAKATLYDVVAGRVGYEGFLMNKGGNPMPPDQVLFSRADAPVRYQEDDKYFAHRHLPSSQRLPDSDLLKAIHSYASDFYGSGKLGNPRNDFKSLDETALIAMGILIEEAVAESLGKTARKNALSKQIGSSLKTGLALKIASHCRYTYALRIALPANVAVTRPFTRFALYHGRQPPVPTCGKNGQHDRSIDLQAGFTHM
ncbi:hypothetical protein AC579_1942 [Pseudocercospora musae]|uniref:Uncharacterized protein n=1 Tax=Pseudocercospora musae TaxID=113226 RepID=A0A139I803_9PEZI|nr:hypothetical protein AC579_1942 [Pseudocercospora musae]